MGRKPLQWHGNRCMGGIDMNRGKTIKIDDAVKRLTEKAVASEEAEPEFARGVYSAIWELLNNIPVIEDSIS